MPKRKVEEPPPSDDEASGSGSEEDESSGSDGSSEGSSGASSGSDSDSLPDASEDGPSSEDDEDGEAYKEITVDFEFMGPKEKDFLGLRALLQTYLDGTPYNVSQLVDLIIKQVRPCMLFQLASVCFFGVLPAALCSCHCLCSLPAELHHTQPAISVKRCL